MGLNSHNSEIDINILSSCSHIDLRSEKEYNRGTIPGSINISILNNLEYETVGIDYRLNGQDSAISLGSKLVSGNKKNNRIDLWKRHIKKNPGCFIFCHRGGKRSLIAKKWLSEIDIEVGILVGGYKRFRSYILDQHKDKSTYKKKWKIIGGLTGSGKTNLLKIFPESIDLEKIANHRGSAFGGKNTRQPSQSNFENEITLRYMNSNNKKIILEDESRTIGKVSLPNSWYDKMQTSDLIVLEVKTEQRINNIINDYIFEDTKLMESKYLRNKYLLALEKIQKRLGADLYKSIAIIINDAFNKNDFRKHEDWINKLLKNYYDPMYKYKLSKRKNYIKYVGDYNSCIQYIKSE